MSATSLASNALPRFPIRLLKTGLLVMAAIVALGAGMTWHVGKTVEEINQTRRTITLKAERLRHYGEALAMSAKAAALSGDGAYVEKYRTIQPQLRAVFHDLQQSLRDPMARKGLETVDRADEQLTKMEFRALDLVEMGNREHALALLNSPTYQELERTYEQGLGVIQERTVQALRRQADQLAWYRYLDFLASLLCVLVVVVAWGLIVRPARHWGRQMERMQDALRAEIAERSIAQEHLRQTSDTLQAVIEAAPAAIITRDCAGTILSWNHTAERIFGYSAAEIVGKPYPLVPDSDREEGKKVFEHLLSGNSVRGFEAKRLRKDGHLVDVSLSASPVYDATGSVRGLVYIFEDVTQRKAAEDRVRCAERLEAVGGLTGGLCHEFNNLLAVIIGNLDLLRSRIIETMETRELLQGALDASLRGAELNRRLLAFARRQPLRPRNCDLNEVVGSGTRLFGGMLGEHIAMSVHAEAGLGRVIVDPAQLETALTNLAVNARHAMPNGGRLTFGTRNVTLDADYAGAHPGVTPGAYVAVEVSDTGMGMAPEVLSRAFEPFFTTRETGKGTGLGLSMVFGFVKQSGGHINIYSEVGAGTTVRIYLPRVEGSCDEADATTSAALRGGNETILAVEDNQSLRRTLVTQLKDLGYTVLEANDGHKALAILAGEPSVDLLLTDIVMPGGLNGWELARRAGEIRPDLKLLFTSGFPEASFEGGTAIPADARLLGKPYRKTDLAEKVREALAA